jgi:hypothetical protein
MRTGTVRANEGARNKSGARLLIEDSRTKIARSSKRDRILRRRQ